MQKIYSRHLSRCRHRDDRDHLACDCPKWVQGKIRGQQIRRSTKENSERRAWRVVDDWIENGLPDDEQQQRQDMTVEQAGTEFLDACKADGNRESTLRYKRELIRALLAFCGARGLRRLADVDAAETGRFRDSWKQGPAQRYKLQKVLKLFFNWACDRRLIDDNPTAKLSQIKVKLRKTEPFTQPQMRAILRAVSDYPGDPETIRAQVLLLRYTGLRGEDAAWLRVDAVEGDHITVDTGKTDEMVRIFAPAAAAALRSIRPKTADSTSGPARAPKRRLARSSTSG